jgi:nitrite reductase/ring-hydroxylating ferredoxin subunit
MGEFVKVAMLSDIPPGQRKAVWVEGQRVLVFNVDGTLYAVDESCPHRECSMLKGQLEGKVIVCPCHSAKFDLESGEVVAQPLEFPPTDPLPVHEVKIEGWDVLVALRGDIDYVV